MATIKAKRIEIGLKQNVVARKLGMSTRNYQRYENEGKAADDEFLEKVSKIFNCSVAEIKQK